MRHRSLYWRGKLTKATNASMIIFFTLLIPIFFGCNGYPPLKPVAATQAEPDYYRTTLQVLADTIHFPLSENVYNEIKSQNIFVHNGMEMIAFFDRKSGTIIIYQLPSGHLYKTIDIKKAFKNNKPYKGTVYFKNFDSIFVTNDIFLYLIDTTGRTINRFDYSEENWIHFDNSRPPVIVGNHLFAATRATGNLNTFKSLKNWRIISDFNLSENGKTKELYQLPELYLKNYFGYQFLDYGYCVNDQGNFVFSFPGDPNVYESNLADFHRSYSVKSRFQKSPIMPVDKKILDSGLDSREYAIRDSYGSIFFDPYHKRYLRQAKQKKSLADFLARTGDRKQTIIILDEHFNIIGESEVSKDLFFDSIFFTKDGRIYTRINTKDEYALHFVRLSYSFEKNKDKPVSIASSHATLSK